MGFVFFLLSHSKELTNGFFFLFTPIDVTVMKKDEYESIVNDIEL